MLNHRYALKISKNDKTMLHNLSIVILLIVLGVLFGISFYCYIDINI